MALLLVNMIGYAVGIRGAGHVAGGIFLDREGLVAVVSCRSGGDSACRRPTYMHAVWVQLSLLVPPVDFARGPRPPTRVNTALLV